MKAKTIQCWIPDVQLEQQDIDHLCIGLNLNQGEFDYDILSNEYEVIDLLEWGFTEEQLIGKTEIAEEIVAENKAPKKNECKLCPACGHEF